MIVVHHCPPKGSKGSDFGIPKWHEVSTSKVIAWLIDTVLRGQDSAENWLIEWGMAPLFDGDFDWETRDSLMDFRDFEPI